MSEQLVPLVGIHKRVLHRLFRAVVGRVWCPWPGMGIWVEHWSQSFGLGIAWSKSGRFANIEIGSFLITFDWN